MAGYNNIGSRIPILRILYTSPLALRISWLITIGTPFFVSGLVIDWLFSKHGVIFHSFLPFVCCFVFYYAEAVIINRTTENPDFVVTLFLYPVIVILFCTLLNKPAENLSVISLYTRDASMIIYYFHIFVAERFEILGLEWGTPVWLATVVSLTIAGIVYTFVMNKYKAYKASKA